MTFGLLFIITLNDALKGLACLHEKVMSLQFIGDQICFAICCSEKRVVVDPLIYNTLNRAAMISDVYSVNPANLNSVCLFIWEL